MKQTVYESVKQFENDFKWFQHNCRTIFPGRRNIQTASNQLIGYVQVHIRIIQACEECFRNTVETLTGNNAGTKQCSKLHLLLWAQVQGYRYWPAKAKAVNVADQTVCVQFFGDLTNSILPCHGCYVYSIRTPDRVKGAHPRSFAKALRVSSLFCRRKIIDLSIDRFLTVLVFNRMPANTSNTFERSSVISIMQTISLFSNRKNWTNIWMRWLPNNQISQPT